MNKRKYAKTMVEKAHEIGVSKQDMQAAIDDIQAREKTFKEMMKYYDSSTGVLDIKGLLNK